MKPMEKQSATKNATKETQCVLVGFWIENKKHNANYKQGWERKKRENKKSEKLEIEHHKILNHPSNPKVRTRAQIKHHKTLN